MRDLAVHRAVLEDLLAWASTNSLQTRGLISSPLRGPAGNMEFLIHWTTHSSKPEVPTQELVEACLSGWQAVSDEL